MLSPLWGSSESNDENTSESLNKQNGYTLLEHCTNAYSCFAQEISLPCLFLFRDCCRFLCFRRPWLLRYAHDTVQCMCRVALAPGRFAIQTAPKNMDPVLASHRTRGTGAMDPPTEAGRRSISMSVQQLQNNQMLHALEVRGYADARVQLCCSVLVGRCSASQTSLVQTSFPST